MADVRTRLDNRAIPKGIGEVRVFMVVRNEMLRLASTLDHYRRLGADRFFIVDNGSDDGTLTFLAAQSDVHLFSTEASYSASHFGMDWMNSLIGEYAQDIWALTADADELFVYPHFERAGLKTLCRFLDAEGARGVYSLMIDMYSQKAIRETFHRAGAPLIETCPCFDLQSYRTQVTPPFPHLQIYGGPRERIFARPGQAGPLLSKVPLVKWGAGMRYVDSMHALEPAIPLSPVLGAILHFKFLSDFHDRAAVEVKRNEHYNNASEYRAYLDALEKNPALSLIYPQSVRYRDSGQLVSLRLIRSSPEFDRMAGGLS
jgi:hypothetical protein